MATLLNELTCLGVAGGVARLVGPRDMVQAARAKAADIEALFRQATGEAVKVQIEGMGGGGAAVAEVREAAETPRPAAEPATPRAPMQEHPLVRQAIEQLGATFVRAQPRVRPAGEG